MAISFPHRSIALWVVLAGGVSSLVLALGMTPALGAFTAAITTAVDGAGSGTIVMQETDSSGSDVCLSTDGGGVWPNVATCSSINRYGGNVGMQPGDSSVVVTYIRNVGTVAASSFSLTPGPCVQSAAGGVSGSATDFCSNISVTIVSGTTSIFTGTAAALGSAGSIDLLALLGTPKLKSGLQVPFTVTTRVHPSVDNTYQGLRVSQAMTWTFTS
jgi:hypothetical protein